MEQSMNKEFGESASNEVPVVNIHKVGREM
jgi:hypothetical protein